MFVCVFLYICITLCWSVELSTSNILCGVSDFYWMGCFSGCICYNDLSLVICNGFFGFKRVSIMSSLTPSDKKRRSEMFDVCIVFLTN